MENTMSWHKIMLGRLFLRFCRRAKHEAEAPGCDCASMRRCSLHSYCRVAKLQSKTADRLEKCFWLSMLAATGSLALYLVLPILYALF